MSVGDAFDLEAGVFEVEEQGGFETGDVEVAEHLGEVAVVEAGDNLGINDDEVIDDEVRNQGADVLAVVTDDEFPLNIALQALFGEFDDEGAFIELFIKAWLEGEEHLVGGADDLFGEFVQVHMKEFLTTERTEYTE